MISKISQTNFHPTQAKNHGKQAVLAPDKNGAPGSEPFLSGGAHYGAGQKNRKSRLLGHVNFDDQKYCFVKKK